MGLQKTTSKSISSDQSPVVKTDRNGIISGIPTNSNYDEYTNKTESARRTRISSKLPSGTNEIKRLSSELLVEGTKSSNSNELNLLDPLPLSIYYPNCIPTLPVLDWNLRNSLYNVPSIPVILDSIPILGTHVLCPYVSTNVVPPITPVAPVMLQNEVPTPSFLIKEIPSSFSYEPTLGYPNEADCIIDVPNSLLSPENRHENIQAEYSTKPYNMQEIESYLKLPKALFPSTKALNLDPNALIDEFCKMKNVKHHTSWLLDLEFGIPKSPITRPIPSYNPKFNSIHCKNAPGAIHPGFEICNEDFKRALLFYYDCIVSSLYRGFMIMNCDRSVENFQSWLLYPMQALGMCWL